MAGKGTKTVRRTLLLFILALAVLACLAPAHADDAELLKELPGEWACPDEVQEGEDVRVMDLGFLTLGEDGKAVFRCNSRDGEYAWSSEGTWAFELVPDSLDRLTLTFTSTDNPAHAGEEYSVECVYTAYAEGWVENDTSVTYVIIEPVSCSGVSPFEECFGYDGAAMHREQGPNMKVVNCSSYVSLRADRSKNAARLAKVPLGARVLAFPEEGDESGFVLCVYGDQYGYILAEYLEPVE